jgi:alcohol dehydrogenase
MRSRSAILRNAPVQKPYRDTKPLSIEEVELDPPGRDEVLIKIVAAGVCHSDLSGINGDRPRPTPVALGHEASGTVAALGPGVDDLEVGDHVVMSFLPVCGHCAPCSEGRGQLCEPGHAAGMRGTLLSGERRIRCEGVEINHHSGVSAFGEHAVVSRRSVVKITKDVDLVEAALFGCAVMTGVGTVINTCNVKLGQSVAVIGLGGVGLSAVLGAAAAGAGRVIAIDLNASKFETARAVGATDTVLASDPDVVQRVREMTNGGVDHAIEMAGAPAAFDLAFNITRRGGTTATAGLSNPNARFPIPPVPLVGEERTIKGSYMGSCIPSRDIPRFIELWRQGRLPVEKLMSGKGPLEGINEAFDRLDRGEVIRHLIVM